MSERKTEWMSQEGLSEKDPTKLFWRVIKLLREGNIKEAIELSKDDIYIFPHLAIKYLKPGGGIPLEPITQPTLAYLILKLFIENNCAECVKQIVREMPDKISIAVGLIRLMNETKKAVEIIKSLLKDKDVAIEMLDVLSAMPNENLEPLLDEIMYIAKNEIDLKQHKALEILTEFVDNREVRKIFASFIDDWDPEVRRISIRALMHVEPDEELIERVKSALRDEDEKELKAMLKRIIRGKHGRKSKNSSK